MVIHVGEGILLKSLTTLFLTVNGGSCVSPSLDLDKTGVTQADWVLSSFMIFALFQLCFIFPKEIFSLSLTSLPKLNA